MELKYFQESIHVFAPPTKSQNKIKLNKIKYEREGERENCSQGFETRQNYETLKFCHLCVIIVVQGKSERNVPFLKFCLSGIMNHGIMG